MEELKQHTLESFRPEFPKEVKPGDIIVAGRNFGCGSHRPATVLREVGIAAIVVESASRLFLRNTIALPMPIYVAPGINDIVKDGETLEIDYKASVARNVATGESDRDPEVSADDRADLRVRRPAAARVPALSRGSNVSCK